MLDAIAVELVTGAVAHAGSRVASQLHDNLRRRRNRQTDEEAVSGLLCTPRVGKSLRLHKVSYPPGMTPDGFKRFMQDPATDGVVFEVLVSVLADAPAASRQAIFERWCGESKRQLPLLSEDDRRHFVGKVFEIIVEECQAISATLDSDYPTIAEKVRSQSHYQRIAAVLEAIERRLERGLPPSDQEFADEQSFIANYRAQATKAHGFITPPDFDRRKRVPLGDIYVSPTIKSTRVGERDKIAVAELISRIDRTVLLGDPGGGKSTAASVTIHSRALDTNGVVPFLVTLREFAAGEEIEQSVVEHIEKKLKVVYQCPPPTRTIERLLESGRGLVIFDGLDELLDTTKRRQVTDLVDLFCSRYPLTRVLVTSRRVGYDQAPMDPKQFSTYEIFGFEDAQVEEYVTKWFAQDESLTAEEAAGWAEAFVEESSSVPDLRSNPLLLALMCIIYRGEHSIPKNRPAVYERCATMLFEKWDSSRKIHVELRVGMLVDPAMKYLAYWMLTQRDGTEGVPEATLIRQTSDYLQSNDFEDALEADAAAKEFVEFCRGRAWVFSDAGSTADGESLYKFTHRTFMEYFAAYHLTRIHDSPDKLARSLAPRVANAEWDMVAQLALQIVEKHTQAGAERFFSYLLSERVRRAYEKRANILAFLGRCLPFVTVTPRTLRSLIGQILTHNVHIDRTGGRNRRTSAIEAYGSLLGAAVGPREGPIRSEIRSQLVRWAQNEEESVANQALLLAMLGWIGIYVGPSPSVYKVNMFEQIELSSSMFDDAYPKALPAVKKDQVVQVFAWGRGFHQLEEITGVDSRGRLDPPLWVPLVFKPHNFHMDNVASALAVWFALGHNSWLPLRDPKALLAQVGRLVTTPGGSMSPRASGRATNLLSNIQHASEEPATVGFEGFSEDALVGGLWLLWTSFMRTETGAIEELYTEAPTRFGRAKVVAEYYLRRESADLDEIPEVAKVALQGWSEARDRTIAGRKRANVPGQKQMKGAPTEAHS